MGGVILSKVYDMRDDEFTNMVKSSRTYSECLRKLGLSTNGGHSQLLVKKRCKELSIDTSHFIGRNGISPYRRKIANEEIFVEDSKYLNMASLKKRIIEDNLIPYKCDKCGNQGEWLGKKLTLQIDHINGNHFDNRLENLRFLCPNCHAQTSTYAGKNKMGG